VGYWSCELGQPNEQLSNVKCLAHKCPQRLTARAARHRAACATRAQLSNVKCLAHKCPQRLTARAARHRARLRRPHPRPTLARPAHAAAPRRPHPEPPPPGVPGGRLACSPWSLGGRAGARRWRRARGCEPWRWGGGDEGGWIAGKRGRLWTSRPRGTAGGAPQHDVCRPACAVTERLRCVFRPPSTAVLFPWYSSHRRPWTARPRGTTEGAIPRRMPLRVGGPGGCGAREHGGGYDGGVLGRLLGTVKVTSIQVLWGGLRRFST
jgi:hypothetical protein